ncbi:hypothetical protein F750_5577 [Streptomyces sp. PAMC 26508]|nr:hypothetical protein F750_5577 [Streptomyces sp. PAMC 26508]
MVQAADLNCWLRPGLPHLTGVDLFHTYGWGKDVAYRAAGIRAHRP